MRTLIFLLPFFCFTFASQAADQPTTPKPQSQYAGPEMIADAANLHPFDLQGRMKFAVNAMTSTVYPWSDGSYIPCGGCGITYLSSGGVADCRGRFSDALWMIRSATDNHSNDEVVRLFARDSMTMRWCPEPAQPGDSRPPAPGLTHLPEVTRLALGNISYYRATGDRHALESSGALIRRFYELAQKNDKYVWYVDFDYELLGEEVLPKLLAAHRTGKAAMIRDVTKFDPRELDDPRSFFASPSGNQPAAMMGLILLPAARYYEETRDPLAAEYMTKFCQTLVDFRPEFGKTVGQCHSNLACVSGAMLAGRVLGKPEFTAWAEKAFLDFTSVDWLPDFGWIPEVTHRPRKHGWLWDETCATADYIELAFQMALHRDEKFWDLAERIAMNQLMESQMLRIDFMDRIPAEAKTPPSWAMVTDHVLERALGTFGVYVMPNDLLHLVPPEAPMDFGGPKISPLGACCLGSGARALYEAWYYAAQEEGDTVRVNMQFSKRLPSALILSRMPGQASVEIQMTDSKNLLVRKPDWAAAEAVQIRINGQPQTPVLRGTFFDFGRLAKGAVVQLDFPNDLKIKQQRIGSAWFSTLWRGNAMVAIQPAGEIYPTYQNRDRKDPVQPLAYVDPKPVDPL